MNESNKDEITSQLDGLLYNYVRIDFSNGTMIGKLLPLTVDRYIVEINGDDYIGRAAIDFHWGNVHTISFLAAPISKVRANISLSFGRITMDEFGTDICLVSSKEAKDSFWRKSNTSRLTNH